MVETLVFRLREAKDLLEISIEIERFFGDQRGNHAQCRHSCGAYQAGKIWKIFSSIGPLLGQ